MPYVTVGQENGQNIDIHFEDHGQGQCVVLIHGYPLNGRSWERQEAALLEAGYRVVSYDRRGFGQSSQPSGGYDYNTFAADLDELLKHLNLNDVILAGFSMGGGEVARYLGRFGSGRIAKAIFASPVAPFLVKTGDNPEGVDKSVFDGIMDAIRADRFAFLEGFFQNFYNVDVLKGDRISEAALHASFNVAAASSARAMLACVPAWLEDFRSDVASIKIPTLIVQGDADRILPIEATGARLPKLIEGSEFVVIKGGPHAIGWTHAEELNAALLAFIQK
jgi:non-heme chloroperoxidase